MKTLPEIYDVFAATYDQNRSLFDMAPVLNDFCNRLTVDRGRLLDLGCGAGEPFAKYFIDHGWEVTGIDFSKKMLELAARHVPEMKTICGDMQIAQFDSNCFDAITAVYSLFHVPRRHHASLFQKCYQWLRPNGKFLFTYATCEYTGHDEFDGFKEFLGERLFYSHNSPDQLRQDLQNTGFLIESASLRNIGSEIFLWVTAGKKAA
ncbi:MAG: class I SAM-dependent methyltransferase [Smithellaceae bacterium]